MTGAWSASRTAGSCGLLAALAWALFLLRDSTFLLVLAVVWTSMSLAYAVRAR